jgi:hypothetical protein
MARQKDRKEKKPAAGRVARLPNFGAEAALGPASRTYRSPMEAYPDVASGAVLPSQLDAEETVDDESDMEGAEVEADDGDEPTGEMGSDDDEVEVEDEDADEAVDEGEG